MRVKPANDNGSVKIDWLGVLIWIAFLALPGGLIAAWWFETGWPLAFTVAAIIFFMGG